MSIKGQKYPAETLTSIEVQSLLNACSDRCPTGRRNRALIVVLWRGGLRISEALDLEPRDLRDGKVTIRHGKGNKPRIVALDPQAWAVVDRWLVDQAPGKKVFVTLAGRPLLSRYCRALFTRLGKKAGIGRRVHPHGLRHSFACDLASEGADLRVVSKALGHANLQVTSIYLDHLNPVEVIDLLQARTW